MTIWAITIRGMTDPGSHLSRVLLPSAEDVQDSISIGV